MPLVEGAVFAGYSIQRLLGAGGMGEVYLAAHPRLPRLDAVKVLRADLTDEAGYRERFDREAEVAASLSHRNIVGVYDRGEFDGRLWLSMEYVAGTDAARLVRDRFAAGMPVSNVVEIVSAVAGALDYAHGRGLLHRDVKPANILLSESEGDERQILLADFGIARRADDVSGLTATNVTVGSVAFAAPEQLMGEQIDGRADEYGLAATAFALLTGAAPFPQSNTAVVISKHLNTPVPS
jgi:serine/threonine-protein kinase